MDTPASSANELAALTPAVSSERLHSCGVVDKKPVDELPADAISVEAVSQNADLSQHCFSIQRNPYLFPLDLFSHLTGQHMTGQRSKCEPTVSGCDSSSAENGLSRDCETEDRPAWWLIHTKSRQEKKLAEQLASCEVPHFLPVIKHWAVTRGKERFSSIPLFSGYMFLYGDSLQRRIALETNRVVSTYRVVESEDFCERICELADMIEKGAPLTAEARISAGRLVRIKAGVFKDKQGTVSKRAGKTRLFVFVNELLGGVSMEVEEHLLEPIY